VDKSLLVRLCGFPATLIHGDPFVLDRWLWLRSKLPETRNAERLLDVGCGSGAFSIGAALRGYTTLGLSWEERNLRVARERAQLCGAQRAEFEVFDIRRLGERSDLIAAFDLVIACEVIEHVSDDRKLLRDMAACLRPGGRLLLTTPNYLYKPITVDHAGPFRDLEDGHHVRRGYSAAMLRELCEQGQLIVSEFAHCGGLLSQNLCGLQIKLARLHSLLAWGATLPLRAIPPLADRWLTDALHWPHYSICLEAYKPRFSQH